VEKGELGELRKKGRVFCERNARLAARWPDSGVGFSPHLRIHSSTRTSDHSWASQMFLVTVYYVF
jgi:hypothetical protein